MQHPLELGAAHYFPAEAFPDHRSHRYRSFMIEEILTDPPDAKGAAPAGELLKFGVQALLSARPYHNHLGTCCRGAGPPPGSGLRAPRPEGSRGRGGSRLRAAARRDRAASGRRWAPGAGGQSAASSRSSEAKPVNLGSEQPPGSLHTGQARGRRRGVALGA